jgi:hypothetical protein
MKNAFSQQKIKKHILFRRAGLRARSITDMEVLNFATEAESARKTKELSLRHTCGIIFQPSTCPDGRIV